MNKRHNYSNLEAIFRSVKDGIVTVDKDLKVIELNKAATDICNFSYDNLGADFRTLIEYRDKRCLDAILKTMEQQKTMEIHHVECKCKHRQDALVHLTTSPLIDKYNHFSGVVLTIRDEEHQLKRYSKQNARQHFHKLLGQNEKMQKIYGLIHNLSMVDTTVLLTGESGTGKELVAEALHYMGPRKDKILVKVNCAALSDDLLESELFGHIKGSFTGAINNKIGRFELADGGTIFLDEIGDITPRMQLRLLRVLQEMKFERVGDANPIEVDVRIIAATNQNLSKKVSTGEFRNDLYYRLKVVETLLPPLRERRDDIPILVKHFIETFNRKFNKKINDISDDVNNIFMMHTWPGNVRELKHTLEHAFVLCHQSTITLNHLPIDLNNLFDNTPLFYQHRPVDSDQEILRALEKTAWNKTQAARLLGISRRTIYRKMEQYNIFKK